MDIIVGTAGHIDHGKTTLVKALTGVDADRLPEEKKRGITIDLGFAELELDGTRLGFVDVPGHERFVKNMLAGASGIDLVMLVIAADEGVMPQTREHFEICRLLGTKMGVVVLTKTDLVEDELVELAELDASELVKGSFLEGSAVIPVSSKTGSGIDELKKALLDAAGGVPARADDVVARLPIDRSFSVKGFGAVVTGTLVSGSVRVGDDLELLPDGAAVRVRGLQTHGRQVDEAHAGQRTAVNLGGIDHSAIERGMMLAEPSVLEPTQIVDAEIEVLADSDKPLRTRQRVRVHVGTLEALARVDVLNTERRIEQGARDLAQLRLEIPAAVIGNERLIIRQYSPQITIAGGIILDAQAKKHKRKDLDSVCRRLADTAAALDDPQRLAALLIGESAERGLTVRSLIARTGWRKEIAAKALEDAVCVGEAVHADGRYLSKTHFAAVKARISRTVKSHHASDPLAAGISRETLRERTGSHVASEVFRFALGELERDGSVVTEKEVVRLSTHSRELKGEESRVFESLKRIYLDSGLQVPSLKEALAEASRGTGVSLNEARRIFQLLVDSAEVVKVSDEFFFARGTLDELIERLRKFASEEAENRLVGVPEFKEMAGISRKYAIPLLEYLDSTGVTRRAGDKRQVL